ncbi:octapeptide-repeat protein T2-like [Macrobrachium rosenbergii]|uniref:octapeptide-repeat protein T2-like n=1 Tax=Macrobrachium rosenbergii TaxID=79674 RepID=UPI0034D5EB60
MELGRGKKEGDERRKEEEREKTKQEGNQREGETTRRKKKRERDGDEGRIKRNGYRKEREEEGVQGERVKEEEEEEEEEVEIEGKGNRRRGKSAEPERAQLFCRGRRAREGRPEISDETGSRLQEKEESKGRRGSVNDHLNPAPEPGLRLT